MNLNDKIWQGDKKLRARKETIIDIFRSRSVVLAVPYGTQYWTLCGQCTDTTGKPNPESELCHLLAERFIQPRQFHGVEKDPAIVKANRKAFPGVHWHCGDLVQVLCAESRKPDFQPAVINVDLTSLPFRAAQDVADIMHLLTDMGHGRTMLVANMVLQHQNLEGRTSSILSFVNELRGTPGFSAIWQSKRWVWPKTSYVYEGTGTDSRSVMGTLIFWKDR